MDVPTTSSPRTRSRRGDRVTAVILLAAGFVVALIGWYAVWLVVSLLTTSSEGRPLCPVGEGLINGVPATAFVFLVLGITLVVVRWWRGRTVWTVAAVTLACIFLTYIAFAVIALTVGRHICM